MAPAKLNAARNERAVVAQTNAVKLAVPQDSYVYMYDVEIDGYMDGKKFVDPLTVKRVQAVGADE